MCEYSAESKVDHVFFGFADDINVLWDKIVIMFSCQRLVRFNSVAQNFERSRTSLPISAGIYFTPQQEAWVVERFGKYHRTLEPVRIIIIWSRHLVYSHIIPITQLYFCVNQYKFWDIFVLINTNSGITLQPKGEGVGKLQAEFGNVSSCFHPHLIILLSYFSSPLPFLTLTWLRIWP